MNDSYTSWLAEIGTPLYTDGHNIWRKYHHALVPSKVSPHFIRPSLPDSQGLLEASKALFIRFASHPTSHETDWWYIVCDQFNPKMLSSQTRYQINRGKKHCHVRKLDAQWLAKHGYDCYSEAFRRYKNARPQDEESYRCEMLAKAGGPFEFWGVFTEQRLAGYCECIIDNDYVSTNIFKFHPNYLKNRTAFVLNQFLIDYYVVERDLALCNGSRNIAHKTNYQDFLLRLGYRKLFCRLNIVYATWLEHLIKAALPLHTLLAHMPGITAVHNFASLLYQEKLRLKCTTHWRNS